MWAEEVGRAREEEYEADISCGYPLLLQGCLRLSGSDMDDPHTPASYSFTTPPPALQERREEKPTMLCGYASYKTK